MLVTNLMSYMTFAWTINLLHPIFIDIRDMSQTEPRLSSLRSTLMGTQRLRFMTSYPQPRKILGNLAFSHDLATSGT